MCHLWSVSLVVKRRHLLFGREPLDGFSCEQQAKQCTHPRLKAFELLRRGDVERAHYVNDRANSKMLETSVSEDEHFSC